MNDDPLQELVVENPVEMVAVQALEPYLEIARESNKILYTSQYEQAAADLRAAIEAGANAAVEKLETGTWPTVEINTAEMDVGTYRFDRATWAVKDGDVYEVSGKEHMMEFFDWIIKWGDAK